MRKVLKEQMFEEITRPALHIWKEAKRSDANGNIYVVRKTDKGSETIHVRK